MTWRQSYRRHFLTLLATALALGLALAHALELPAKMDLGREAYFEVQQIYRGWSVLGILLVMQIGAIVWLALGAPGGTAVRRLAVVAGACVLGAQVVFWTLTYPANVATANWTWMPADWEMLRRQWEYAHAGGATFQAGAMILLILAALIDTKPHGCP